MVVDNIGSTTRKYGWTWKKELTNSKYIPQSHNTLKEQQQEQLQKNTKHNQIKSDKKF